MIRFLKSTFTFNLKSLKQPFTNFSISDTASIDKIKLSSTLGSEFTVVRNESGNWIRENGDCIQNELIQNLLLTIFRVKVKGPVSNAQKESVMNNLNQSHTKAEIFIHGILMKTYYVGSPTMDHYGTFMLLELPEKGRSNKPMVTYIPGFRGNIQSRFSTDWKQWACSEIFTYAPSNIKKISFKDYEKPENSFEIESDGVNAVKLLKDGKNIEVFHGPKVRGYLLRFQKIHFNQHNYTLDEVGIDSIRKMKPYVEFKVEGHDDSVTGIVCYKMRAAQGDVDLDGNPLEWDQNVMWAFLDNGDLVKVQYFAFDKIMKPISYFLPISKNVDN